MIREEKTVKELIEQVVEEALDIMKKFGNIIHR